MSEAQVRVIPLGEAIAIMGGTRRSSRKLPAGEREARKAAYDHRRYIEHREAILARQKVWRQANPEKERERSRRARARKITRRDNGE